MTRRLRAGVPAALAAALVPLAGCSDSVAGPAAPAGGGADGAGGSDPAGATATCEWVAARSGNPYAVEVDPPDAEVPAEGTAALRMTTSLGEIGLTLDRGAAPCAAASTLHLARLGFFDDSACHRLVDTVVVIVMLFV